MAADYVSVELLSEQEKIAVSKLADVAMLLSDIIGDGPTRGSDLAEAVTLIHGLQNMILAQAAARAFPKTYRLLGVEVEKDVDPGVVTSRRHALRCLKCDRDATGLGNYCDDHRSSRRKKSDAR